MNATPAMNAELNTDDSDFRRSAVQEGGSTHWSVQNTVFGARADPGGGHWRGYEDVNDAPPQMAV